MTALTTKPGALALAYLEQNEVEVSPPDAGGDSSAWEAVRTATLDLRALVAERDDSVALAQFRKVECEQREAALKSQVAMLREALERALTWYELHLRDEALKSGEKHASGVCPCWEAAVVPGRAALAATEGSKS